MSSKGAPKRSVKSVSSVRGKNIQHKKRLPTPHTSSPIGVTSHITPLLAGEGLGEGPLSCGLEMYA